jgi:hypothetical protein
MIVRIGIISLVRRTCRASPMAMGRPAAAARSRVSVTGIVVAVARSKGVVTLGLAIGKAVRALKGTVAADIKARARSASLLE